MTTYTTTTDAALLERLHDPTDKEAWRQFRAIYRPRIVAACRSAGLDQWNADGLAEEILLKLLELLPAFQYDPEKGRFRGWLYGVVHNVVRKFKRRDGKGISPGGTDHHEAMHQHPDPNALAQSVTDTLLKEARLRRMMLLHEALKRVRERMHNPERLKAFWEVRAEGEGPTETAGDLKMTPAAVSVAGREVMGSVRKELERTLNRLLADAQACQASKELAKYAGKKVADLRRAGVSLMETLKAELEKLLKGLEETAVKGKDASVTVRDLGIPPGDYGRAANQYGACVEEEVNELESKEAEPNADSSAAET